MRTDWSDQWSWLYVGGPPEPTPYRDDAVTYMRAGICLSGPGLVEEWGCATTWGKRFVGAPYRGIDGAEGIERWGATRADLRTYRSSVPKILMRHVLEHNWEWRDILQNALASYTERMVLIFFIPPGEGDVNFPEHGFAGGPDTPPVLQVDRTDLENILNDYHEQWSREDVIGGFCPPFNHEVVYWLWR